MNDTNERSVGSAGSGAEKPASVTPIRTAIYQMSMAATMAYAKMEVSGDMIGLSWDSSVTDEELAAIKRGVDAQRQDFDDTNCEELANTLLGVLERIR
jgi:hypothetical protein